MIQADIIFDIGAHNGADTAWYLQQGYRVIAVEANPMLSKELENKFREAVNNEKLTVVNKPSFGLICMPDHSPIHIA